MTETDFSVGKETDVKLTIRCAMQAFPDWKIECSSVWTVLQLKSFIAKNCTTKPVSRFIENITDNSLPGNIPSEIDICWLSNGK